MERTGESRRIAYSFFIETHGESIADSDDRGNAAVELGAKKRAWENKEFLQ